MATEKREGSWVIKPAAVARGGEYSANYKGAYQPSNTPVVNPKLPKTTTLVSAPETGKN